MVKRAVRSSMLVMMIALAACETPASTPDAGPPDAGAPDAGPVLVMATTESGPVNGVDEGGVLVFRGLPYAAPPIGDLRLAPPAPVAPWTEVRDATVDGPICPQPAGLTGGSITGDEDCLYLDVWTPALDGARPVMVWIHGGGFTTGTGSDPLFDGTNLVTEGDVVVVTINYRLGALGFLAHPALGAATEPTGNWGFLDQQAALRWVQANAAHFGGDPANVTVFGESAGGASTLLHTVAPGSAGLFARTIEQSGLGLFVRERAPAEDIGAMVASALGCTGGDVAACLRAADRDALLGAVTIGTAPGGALYQDLPFPFSPVMDGVTFAEPPLAAIRAGRIAPGEMLLGTNTDEGTLFHSSFLGEPVTTDAEYRAALDRLIVMAGVSSTFADEIATRYPSTSYPTPNDALIAVTGEGLFHCATRYLARQYVAAGHTTYLYHFDQVPGRSLLVSLGVFHSAELPFVFGNSGGPLGDSSTAPELGLAMRARWTAFAHGGDPGGTPAWPAYDPATDTRLLLAPTLAVEPADPDGRCAFWDGFIDAI